MKKKISIGDIAKELGVSKTTVSFVLNGKGRENHISEALESKILKYIKEVGYQPNQFARGLRTGKTQIIGMLIEDISDPFFSSIARLIEEKAYKKGYKIVYSSTENDTQKTKELINIYRTRQVDGYIIAPSPGIEEDVKALLSDNLPVVLFDRFFPEIETDTVVVDNFEGTYNAINHLYENGYKNIALITLESDQVQMQDRLNGYVKAVEAHPVEPIIKKVVFHEEVEKTVKEIEKFLKANKQVDAVFFATNYLADAGLEAIQNLGIKISKDLGVIVFDDYNLFRLFTPSITAVAQPIQSISENVINILLKRLSDTNKVHEKKTVVVPTNLIIRNSAKNTA